MQVCKEPVAHTALTYRPDLDGLRAVAVMGVVAFHLGAFRANGGFVGVDVFFVISGFLIGSIILRDLDQSRFSLLAFYERRIRRILPALVAMMLITTFVCSYYQLPSELQSTGRSLIAATFSVSNIYYLLATAYIPSYRSEAFSPTWSLAVEEQFYIFFPLFLILVRRYLPGRLKTVVITVAAISFVVSAFGAYLFPCATAYLPFTRAWELLLGAMAAIKVFPCIDSVLGRNLVAFTGLAGIVFCILTYSYSLPFPGVAALAPCLGAVLIIAAGETGNSLVSRALSFKPVVFLGLISYSLYLWHVPVMMFQRFGLLQIPTASHHIVNGATLVLCILVATLSWKFVETPFRSGRLMLKGRSAFAFAAVSAVMLTVLGGTLVALHGLGFRYTQQEVALSSYIGTAFLGNPGSCFIEQGFKEVPKPYDAEDCLRQDPSRKNYLLIGDSYASQLWYGLQKAFPNINFMQAGASDCEPLMQSKGVHLPDAVDSRVFGDVCRPMMEYIYSEYLVNHHVDRVLMASNWEPSDLPRLDDTIRALKRRGLDILLFGTIMQYDADLPRLLVSSLRGNDPALPSRHRLERYQALDQEMSGLARTRWGVDYVSYFQLLCRQQLCLEFTSSDTPLQSDSGHFTTAGSVLVAQRLRSTGVLMTPHQSKMYVTPKTIALAH